MWASPPTNIHETFFHTIVLRKKEQNDWRKKAHNYTALPARSQENKKTRPEYSQDGATRAIFI